MISARLEEQITTGNDYVAFDAVYHDNNDHDIDDIDDDDDESIHNFFRAVFMAKELEMTAPADRLEAAK